MVRQRQLGCTRAKVDREDRGTKSINCSPHRAVAPSRSPTEGSRWPLASPDRRWRGLARPGSPASSAWFVGRQWKLDCSVGRTKTTDASARNGRRHFDAKHVHRQEQPIVQQWGCVVNERPVRQCVPLHQFPFAAASRWTARSHSRFAERWSVPCSRSNSGSTRHTDSPVRCHHRRED